MGSKPLVNDAVLRRELAKLEQAGTEEPEPVSEPDDPTVRQANDRLPPRSGERLLSYAVLDEEEIRHLQVTVKLLGMELINDGGCYRAKRGRDFMIWTLETSPLVPEERGGGEGHALAEIVRRFGKS
jgi:hypothetical protein